MFKRLPWEGWIVWGLCLIGVVGSIGNFLTYWSGWPIPNEGFNRFSYYLSKVSHGELRGPHWEIDDFAPLLLHPKLSKDTEQLYREAMGRGTFIQSTTKLIMAQKALGLLDSLENPTKPNYQAAYELLSTIRNPSFAGTRSLLQFFAAHHLGKPPKELKTHVYFALNASSINFHWNDIEESFLKLVVKTGQEPLITRNVGEYLAFVVRSNQLARFNPEPLFEVFQSAVQSQKILPTELITLGGRVFRSNSNIRNSLFNGSSRTRVAGLLFSLIGIEYLDSIQGKKHEDKKRALREQIYLERQLIKSSDLIALSELISKGDKDKQIGGRSTSSYSGESVVSAAQETVTWKRLKEYSRQYPYSESRARFLIDYFKREGNIQSSVIFLGFQLFLLSMILLPWINPKFFAIIGMFVFGLATFGSVSMITKGLADEPLDQKLLPTFTFFLVLVLFWFLYRTKRKLARKV